MSTDMLVIVCDPVNPHDLFAAAAKALGDPRWHELNFGGGRMIQALEQPKSVRVTVHCPSNGGPWHGWKWESDPDGYATVSFSTAADGDRIALLDFAAAALGIWLRQRHVGWLWMSPQDSGSWETGA